MVAAVETPGYEDAAVVVRTSGSTGTPKATVLTVDALAASSMATAFALKGEGQWLLALPVQYVAGVQVLVRSLFAGTRPWAMDLSGGFTPEAFTAAALELTDKIRFTSLVPTQLQRLLDAPSAETLAVLRRFNGILLGGGPASPGAAGRRPRRRRPRGDHLRLRRDLRRLRVRRRSRSRTCWCGWPRTAASCWAAPPSPPATWMPRNSRRRRSSRTTASAGTAPTTSARSTTTGKLTVLGRADDVVITGGVKVSAAHVQAELERLDGVRAAFVAGVPSAEWGQALAAYVALADSSPEGIEGFTAGAAWAPALGALAPKTVLAAGELLMLPNGKPDRLAMTVRLTELHQGK